MHTGYALLPPVVASAVCIILLIFTLSVAVIEWRRDGFRWWLWIVAITLAFIARYLEEVLQWLRNVYR